MRARGTLIGIIVIFLVALWVNLPQLPWNYKIPFLNIDTNSLLGRFPLRFGLDLQGGTQLVLLADTSRISSGDQDSALESAKDIIERRVNLYGVNEAVVQTSRLGDQRRILVDLPGVTDASAAAQLVGKTAKLDFREQPASFSAEATQSAFLQIFEYVSTGITGADLKRAQVVFNQAIGARGGPQVQIEFNEEGKKKFAEVTKRNVGKPLAIFLDDQPITLPPPIVQTEIVDGTAVITGNFTLQEAKNLAVQLNAGALPVPVKILEQRSIGASLGQESVKKSVVAGVIGLLLVMIYMIVYYGFKGLVASWALVMYTIFVLAIFRTGLGLFPPITLTLAGIAGFILSIGMAVDANILIFERMKEELRQGKSPQQALDLGFKRAWSSIRDSNISSLITAAILFTLGSGLIKGFAVAFAIGVLVSMFTALTVSKTFLKLLMD